MSTVDLQAFKKYIKPFYQNKDSMHDWAHVTRLESDAQALAGERAFDSDLLSVAAFLHGQIEKPDESFCKVECQHFLKKRGCDVEFIERCFLVATESLASAEPQSFEGMLLHDAHLLQGGRSFLVAKSLVTGTERGQSLAETIDFMERFIIGKRRCVLPEAQQQYAMMEAYAVEFINDLKCNFLNQADK